MPLQRPRRHTMHWTMKTACFALLILPAAAQAALTLSVDAKNGDAISGDHKFVVRVQSNAVVTNVEFYANGELISTDDSQPYEFVLDTLRYDDGPIKVRFAGYDRAGGRAASELTLSVDNKLGLGAPHHVAEGEKALTDGDWAAALTAGRTALRIEPANTPARLILARAHNALKRADLAQKFAEDVLTVEPGNAPALALVTAISLDRAMSTFSSRMTTQATANSLSRSLQRAAAAARASGEAKLAGAEGLDRARALYALGRAQEAADLLDRADAPQTEEAKLIRALSRLAAGDRSRALSGLTDLAPSAAGLAASALASAAAAGATRLEQASVQIALTGLPELSARARLALERGDVAGHTALTAIMKQAHPAAAETALNEAISLFGQRQYEAAQEAIKRGILADPGRADLYIERGAQTIAFLISSNLMGPERLIQLSLAEGFADAALEAEPGSAPAAALKALVYVFRGTPSEAAPWLEKAQAGRPYASGFVIAAAAELQSRRNAEAREFMARAARLDPKVNERLLPTPVTAFQHFYRSGRLPRVVLP